MASGGSTACVATAAIQANVAKNVKNIGVFFLISVRFHATCGRLQFHARRRIMGTPVPVEEFTPLRAEIVSVGTELLMGQIVDTNAAYLARGLSEVGYLALSANDGRRQHGPSGGGVEAGIRGVGRRADNRRSRPDHGRHHP